MLPKKDISVEIAEVAKLHTSPKSMQMNSLIARLHKDNNSYCKIIGHFAIINPRWARGAPLAHRQRHTHWKVNLYIKGIRTMKRTGFFVISLCLVSFTITTLIWGIPAFGQPESLLKKS